MPKTLPFCLICGAKFASLAEAESHEWTMHEKSMQALARQVEESNKPLTPRRTAESKKPSSIRVLRDFRYNPNVPKEKW